MKLFLLILQFFTRIPLPAKGTVNPADFPRGVRYFPLAGLVIGILDALVFRLLALGLDRSIAVIGTVLFNICLTGALHLDGLSDTCDGIFSARTRERMLEIMKDSRIGNNGVVAVFFDLALKIALLLQLDINAAVPALIVVPVISRTTMVVLMLTCLPARSEAGLGSLFIGKVQPQDVVIAAVLCLIFIAGTITWQSLPVIALNLMALGGYRQVVISKIGGMTGDTLGAMNEISEVVTLLGLVLLKGVNY